MSSLLLIMSYTSDSYIIRLHTINCNHKYMMKHHYVIICQSVTSQDHMYKVGHLMIINPCFVFIQVRTLKMHLFTIIQVVGFVSLWIIKSTKAALGFPFFLILLVPVRFFLLRYLFTPHELECVSITFYTGNTIIAYSHMHEPEYCTLLCFNSSFQLSYWI